ncbi:MAG: hypothetical protein J7J21_00680 [Methanomicrobia archaeon]|nr:hypothetical protein [Methanomicrobia archaeon]
MKKDISFEIEKSFWDEAVENLCKVLNEDKRDVERGILFFFGKHCGDYLEKFCNVIDEETKKELKIAITHSKQEK